MAVTLNKANLVLKDANGNIGKIEQLSDRDLAKIKTAVSDVALVVNQSNHTPIEATTTNKGVVQLATPADVVSGASDKVVTAEQLHNVTTGTSALATENLARIDAVVTEAGIPIDHTNTNQLKDAVTTLVSSATPATATSTTLGVVKPDNYTITIDSTGVLTATAQMPGVATNTNVGVVKPDNDTITIDSNGVLTATKATQDSAGQQINTTYIKDVTASNAIITVTKGNGTTSTATINNVANATNLGGYPATDYIRSVNSITPDSNGNVVLDLSSSGGIGFPNLSAGVDISNFNGRYTSSTTRTYTLPSNGWVIGMLTIQRASSGIQTVYLNTSPLHAYVHVEDTRFYIFSISLKSGTQIKLQIQNPNGGTPPTVSSALAFYPSLS